MRDGPTFDRRSILETTGALVGAGLLGVGAGVDGAAAAPIANDETDYETTHGVTEPTYDLGAPESFYAPTEFEHEGETESPKLYGELIRPVDPDTGETVEDVPVILTYSPYNDLRSTSDSAHFVGYLYQRTPDGSTERIASGALNAKNRKSLRRHDEIPTDRSFRVPLRLIDIDHEVPNGARLGLVVAADNTTRLRRDPNGDGTQSVVLRPPEREWWVVAPAAHHGGAERARAERHAAPRGLCQPERRRAGVHRRQHRPGDHRGDGRRPAGPPA